MSALAESKIADKQVFIGNPDFYPTPKHLFDRMWAKLPLDFRSEGGYVLEPSAGAGHIIEYIYNPDKMGWRTRNRFTIHAIEKDQQLVATLRGKGHTVVDYDFLTFSGMDKYDLIIGNPPFSEGEHHLLKAIDILYSGHIVFLINAETLRNPYSNARKMLAQKLEELSADIEYIPDAFRDADRKAEVDVALIHIHAEKRIEDDLFEGIEEADDSNPGEAHEFKEVAEKNSIEGMVADYNQKVELCTRTLLDFYKNYYHVTPYLGITVGEDEKEYNRYSAGTSITPIMKKKLNDLLRTVRKSYWNKALTLDAVKKRLTEKKRSEFQKRLQENELMDFTAANIRQFILNLVNDYDQILMDAVLEIFKKMTREFAWHENLQNQNIHYFNGWKTNHAYRANKKVIIPFYGRSFTGWSGQWDLWYDVARQLDDIDRVMNYFDGSSDYYSISEALKDAFKEGESRGIESTYFKISVFKKGTCHLTFKDDDILRRFNVTACKGKEWLFDDYGNKPYSDMSAEEKAVVKSFEDPFTYEKNLTDEPRLFRAKDMIQLEHFESAAL